MPYSSRGAATPSEFHGGSEVSAATGARSRRHYVDRPQVALGGGGGDDRLMTWSSNLNIYRVNRFHPIDLSGDRKDKDANSWGSRVQRFDFIESLLMRNMVDVVEAVFGYVGIESSRDCLLVCRLWYEFLTLHIYKRWAEQLISSDASLKELAVTERWTQFLHLDPSQVEDFRVYKRICFKVCELREVWRFREPRTRRLFCDSFVLCLRFEDTALFCGLNNGALQLWDTDWTAKRREQQIHAKGVKCIDVAADIFVTGSYDCTAKVFGRDSWELLHNITLHTDSVWDLRIHGDVMATAGLDGTVGVFEIVEQTSDVIVRFILQAHEDLVAAVDFNTSLLLTGYEILTLSGHNGGVTGIQLNGSIAASASYDGTIRLWNVVEGTCISVFSEANNFVRCVGFIGHILACGDFGGNVHLWDVRIVDNASRVQVRNYRKFEAHKGHVVCLQLNARRIVTGSRDRTALVQDFWAKMGDGRGRRRREAEASSSDTVVRQPRFLRRPIY